MCLLFYASFSLVIHYSFSIALSALILLWTPKLRKHAQLLATNINYFQQLPYFFSSLNISLIAFIFSSTHHLLINAWSLKLIRPITTSLCVPCITTWKHLASSLWMNVVDFIFRWLHIYNLLTLSVLTPLHLPCTPFADCENTSFECTDFFVYYAHNSNDCANTPNDWPNIATNSTDTPNITSLDPYIPNLALL
jgi:hypothetical protein